MKILPPIKSYKVLDMGCGEGKEAIFLQKTDMMLLLLIWLKVVLKKQKKLLMLIMFI